MKSLNKITEKEFGLFKFKKTLIVLGDKNNLKKIPKGEIVIFLKSKFFFNKKPHSFTFLYKSKIYYFPIYSQYEIDFYFEEIK